MKATNFGWKSKQSWLTVGNLANVDICFTVKVTFGKQTAGKKTLIPRKNI